MSSEANVDRSDELRDGFDPGPGTVWIEVSPEVYGRMLRRMLPPAPIVFTPTERDELDLHRRS